MPGNLRGKNLVYVIEIMLNKADLEETIRDCRKGNRYAQNRLYRAFYAWASATCQRYTRDAEATRECVQDGFFKALTKLDKFEDGQSFEAWLKKILINTCIDRYRAQVNEISTVELQEAHQETTLAEILIDADAAYLLYLVRQLSPAYQATFNLYAVEGYSYPEIAEILGVTLGSVKSNLSKARAKLQEMLLNKAAATHGK